MYKRQTEKRGLLNYRTTPDCMPHLLDEKNVKMLTAHKVFSEAELKSRCEIMLDNYCKAVLIEACLLYTSNKITVCSRRAGRLKIFGKLPEGCKGVIICSV